MSIHINTLEVENVKRVQALTLTPSATGLTVIGGRNGQGKTSVLDAIAWALGGDRYRPENAQRAGANFPPHLKVTLSNGITVERKGKNSALTVRDPSGRKAGQRLLDSFVDSLALDLPKFMNASDREKANTLLKIIGVGPELVRLEQQEQQLYNERLYTGQQQRAKAQYAAELPEVPGTPAQEVSALELIQRQQAILLQNAENQRKRQRLGQLEQERDSVKEQIDLLQEQLHTLNEDIKTARTAAADLVDKSTAELEENIRNIEQINQNVRTNAAKRRAKAEAEALERQYQQLSADITRCREKRTKLLEGADLPLPGLTVEDGRLLYHNQPWANMSGADQLRVATAIVRRLNPKCGFVLVDKLEQMDLDTLREFGRWLEQQGLQAIATRVSTGDECSIIIEDGMEKAAFAPKPAPGEGVKWQKGVF